MNNKSRTVVGQHSLQKSGSHKEAGFRSPSPANSLTAMGSSNCESKTQDRLKCGPCWNVSWLTSKPVSSRRLLSCCLYPLSHPSGSFGRVGEPLPLWPFQLTFSALPTLPLKFKWHLLYLNPPLCQRHSVIQQIFIDCLLGARHCYDPDTLK